MIRSKRLHSVRSDTSSQSDHEPSTTQSAVIQVEATHSPREIRSLASSKASTSSKSKSKVAASVNESSNPTKKDNSDPLQKKRKYETRQSRRKQRFLASGKQDESSEDEDKEEDEEDDDDDQVDGNEEIVSVSLRVTRTSSREIRQTKKRRKTTPAAAVEEEMIDERREQQDQEEEENDSDKENNIPLSQYRLRKQQHQSDEDEPMTDAPTITSPSLQPIPSSPLLQPATISPTSGSGTHTSPRSVELMCEESLDDDMEPSTKPKSKSRRTKFTSSSSQHPTTSTSALDGITIDPVTGEILSCTPEFPDDDSRHLASDPPSATPSQKAEAATSNHICFEDCGHTTKRVKNMTSSLSDSASSNATRQHRHQGQTQSSSTPMSDGDEFNSIHPSQASASSASSFSSAPLHAIGALAAASSRGRTGPRIKPPPDPSARPYRAPRMQIQRGHPSDDEDDLHESDEDEEDFFGTQNIRKLHTDYGWDTDPEEEKEEDEGEEEVSYADEVQGSEMSGEYYEGPPSSCKVADSTIEGDEDEDDDDESYGTENDSDEDESEEEEEENDDQDEDDAESESSQDMDEGPTSSSSSSKKKKHEKKKIHSPEQESSPSSASSDESDISSASSSSSGSNKENESSHANGADSSERPRGFGFSARLTRTTKKHSAWATCKTNGTVVPPEPVNEDHAVVAAASSSDAYESASDAEKLSNLYQNWQQSGIALNEWCEKFAKYPDWEASLGFELVELVGAGFNDVVEWRKSTHYQEWTMRLNADKKEKDSKVQTLTAKSISLGGIHTQATANLPPKAPKKKQAPSNPFEGVSLPIVLSHSPRHSVSPYPSDLEYELGVNSDALNTTATSGLKSPTTPTRAASSTTSAPIDPYVALLSPDLTLTSIFELAKTIPYNFSSIHSASKGWSFTTWSRTRALEQRMRKEAEQQAELRRNEEAVKKIIEEELKKNGREDLLDGDDTSSRMSDDHPPASADTSSSRPPLLPPLRYEKTFQDLIQEAYPPAETEPIAGTPSTLTPSSTPKPSPPSDISPPPACVTTSPDEWLCTIPEDMRFLQQVYERHGMQRGCVPLAVLDLVTPGAVALRAMKYQRSESQQMTDLVRPSKSTLLRRTSSLKKIQAAQHSRQGEDGIKRLSDLTQPWLALIFACLDLTSLLAARSVCHSFSSIISDSNFARDIWSSKILSFASMTSLTGWSRRSRWFLRPGTNELLEDSHAVIEQEWYYQQQHPQHFVQPIHIHHAIIYESEQWFVNERPAAELTSEDAHIPPKWVRSHQGFTPRSVPFVYHLHFDEDILMCQSFSRRMIHPYKHTLHTLEIYNSVTLINELLLGMLLDGLQIGRTATSSVVPCFTFPFPPETRPALPQLTSLHIVNCVNLDLDIGCLFLPYYAHQLIDLNFQKSRGVGGGHLAQYQHFTSLQQLTQCHRIQPGDLPNLLGSVTQLQRLNLRGLRELLPIHIWLLHPLVHLVELDLSWCDQVDTNSLSHLFEGHSAISQNLKRLYLQGCTKLNDLTLIHAISRLTALEVLDVSQTGTITNRGLGGLLYCTHLNRLILRFQAALTDSMTSIIVRMASLNYLDINFCPKISIHGKIAMKNHKKGMPLYFLTV